MERQTGWGVRILLWPWSGILPIYYEVPSQSKPAIGFVKLCLSTRMTQSLLFEAEFFGVQRIVDQIKTYSQCKILKSAEWDDLTKVIPGNVGKLLWRGSDDGFSCKSFHENRDNQGPTIVIIRCMYSTFYFWWICIHQLDIPRRLQGCKWKILVIHL